MRKAAVAAALTAGLLSACTQAPAVVNFTALLDGSSEVPPTSSPGMGTATADLGLAQRVLRWNIQYTGLTGPAIAAHFHCPAGPGVNAPVVVPLHGDLGSPISGIAIVDPATFSALLANQCYVNIHTPANPGGEIRGQLVRTP